MCKHEARNSSGAMSTHSYAAAAAAAARTFPFVFYFNVVQIPVGARDFPLLPNFQTGPKNFLLSGYQSLFLGARREVDNPPPAIAEVRNEWSYNPAPPIFLHGVGRDNFTFTTKFIRLYAIWET